MQTNTFTHHDWQAYLGASKFRDGSDPEIAQIWVDGFYGEIVVDREGVHVQMAGGATGDDYRSWSLFTPNGRAVAVCLNDHFTTAGLLALGFTQQTM